MFFSLFLMLPEQAKGFLPVLSYGLLILSVVFIIANYRSASKRGMITPITAWRKATWDVFKMAVVIFITAVLGKAAATYAVMYGELHWQGKGALAGFLALLIVSLLTVNGVRWVMEQIGKLLKLA